MIIQNVKEKCKRWWKDHERDIFLLAIVFLIITSLLGAIRLMILRRSMAETQKIRIEENAFPISPRQNVGQAYFIASINGGKYYPIGCKAANRIKEENRIWFSSDQEARELGYMPSSQC